MSKQCAKCSKTVYPTEELKCLDKVWHKFCFKCTTCGMTLNLKNFQGFDRMPYCRAHTPKAKHTNVTDTPEINRVKEATKNQSLMSYHEDFEKNLKGTALQVADNLEMERLKKNQTHVSQACYHEQFEKDIRGHKIEVADDPETLRLLKNQNTISNITYHEQFEKGIKGHKIEVADDPETMRHLKNQTTFSDAAYHENFEKNFKGRATQIADDPETLRLLKNQNTFSNVRYQEEYIKSKAGKMPIEGEDQNYSQGDHHQHQQYADTQRMPPPGAVPVHAVSAVPNRINAEDNFNSPYSSRNQGSSVVYSSQGKVEQNQSNRKVGSINDYDPLNEQYGSIAQGHQPYSSYGGQQWQETVPVSRVQAPDTESPDEYEQPPTNGSGPRERPKSKLPPGAVPAAGLVSLSQIQNVAITAIEEDFLPPQLRAQRLEAEKQKETYRGQEQPPAPVSQPPPPAPPSSSSAVYKAMYDYDAADDDEVSFRDGDIIINTEPIDDGWMYGTVQRSGQTGMLPSNYVERIQ